MDIKINAPGHPNQEKLTKYYTSKLNAYSKKYSFLNSISTSIKSLEKNNYEVRIEAKPKTGNMLVAKATDNNENKALKEAMAKLNKQLERFKVSHFEKPIRRRMR